MFCPGFNSQFHIDRPFRLQTFIRYFIPKIYNTKSTEIVNIRSAECIINGSDNMMIGMDLI